MSNSKRMVKVTMWVSKTHAMKIENAAKRTKLPKSRVATLAFDEGLEHNPNLEYDLTLPDEYVEYAFAHEAGKILDYMKKQDIGLSPDMLFVLRHDIGIADKETLFGAFKELIEKEFIVKAKPPQRMNYTYPEDYEFYEVKKDKKQKAKDKRYEKFLKLQREFQKNKETEE